MCWTRFCCRKYGSESDFGSPVQAQLLAGPTGRAGAERSFFLCGTMPGREGNASRRRTTTQPHFSSRDEPFALDRWIREQSWPKKRLGALRTILEPFLFLMDKKNHSSVEHYLIRSIRTDQAISQSIAFISLLVHFRHANPP